MRLITHNMLQCHVKGCNANNFPLQLQEVVLEQEEAELNEDFLRNMLGKIEYEALVDTCLKVSCEQKKKEPSARILPLIRLDQKKGKKT